MAESRIQTTKPGPNSSTHYKNLFLQTQVFGSWKVKGLFKASEILYWLYILVIETISKPTAIMVSFQSSHLILSDYGISFLFRNHQLYPTS